MLDPATLASVPANDRTPYGDLPEYAQNLVDGIITTFFEQAGWPPSMTHDEAKTTMVALLQKGAVSIRQTRKVGEQGWVFVIEITAAGRVLEDQDDENTRVEHQNTAPEAPSSQSKSRNG